MSKLNPTVTFVQGLGGMAGLIAVQLDNRASAAVAKAAGLTHLGMQEVVSAGSPDDRQPESPFARPAVIITVREHCGRWAGWSGR